jgi:hypothetical protein
LILLHIATTQRSIGQHNQRMIGTEADFEFYCINLVFKKKTSLINHDYGPSEKKMRKGLRFLYIDGPDELTMQSPSCDMQQNRSVILRSHVM